MTAPTQAQIEAAASTILTFWSRHPDAPESSDDRISLAKDLALAALTAAAEVGPDYNDDDAPEATVVRLATIERCAQYHDNAAIECEKIAAVNMDNDLGPDCLTLAQQITVLMPPKSGRSRTAKNRSRTA